MRRTGLAFALAVATALGAGSAGAAPPAAPLPMPAAAPKPPRAPAGGSLRLAVLPVLVDPSGQSGVGAVFEGVEEAAASRPVRPTSVDDYFFQDGKELSARALACGEDTACLAEALAVFRADLGMVVIANFEVAPPLLAILLLDTEKRAVLAEHYGELDPGRPLSPQLAEGAALTLEQAGLHRSGFLEVLAEPAGAVIEVGEGVSPDVGQSHRFTLPPGRYPIRVSAPDHAPQQQQVEVRPGQTTRVSVRLERDASIWTSPWLWGGVATVVVAGAVTAAVVASQTPEDCLCIVGSGQDPATTCLRCP